MPGAVPGVGECKICFEIVPSVKVLDCGHSLCLPCAAKILEAGQKKVKQQSDHSTGTAPAIGHLPCPECRAITDCGTQGARSLKTRYFGLLKCDLCLEKKDTDDCWWCSECVRTLCSKCSLKEHGKKGHSISEWNKLEPVKYSVNYLSQVKVARQGSTESECNRGIVTAFVSSVHDALHKELSSQPELDRLQNDLFDRYGSRFKQHQSLSLIPRGSASSPNLLAKEKASTTAGTNDDGARVVAKVLELAGANVSEILIPSLSDQKFQLHFTITPDEVAKYLRSKIEFIPCDRDDATCKWRTPSVVSPNTPSNGSPGTRHSYNTFMDRIREGVEEAVATSSNSADDSSSASEDIFLTSSTPGKSRIVEVDFDGHNLLAFRYATSEVSVVNLFTRRTLSTVPVQMKHECRSLAFSEVSGVLYLALQSTAKRHEWMLEAIDLGKSPICVVFTTPFDIDPEDRVEHVQLSVGAGKKEAGIVYEIRNCTRNVSEIWRASLERKAKTPSKVKLKETMLYQKDESRFTQVLVAQTPNASKEHVLLVWDENSKSLYRLIIRDKRCYSSTKILTAPTSVPFSLDCYDHLWIFDPCTGNVCVSADPILNKSTISFRDAHRFRRNPLQKLWADGSAASLGGDFIFAVHLAFDSKSLKIVKFKKGIADDSPPFGDPRAAIKRRSFSARV